MTNWKERAEQERAIIEANKTDSDFRVIGILNRTFDVLGVKGKLDELNSQIWQGAGTVIQTAPEVTERTNVGSAIRGYTRAGLYGLVDTYGPVIDQTFRTRTWGDGGPNTTYGDSELVREKITGVSHAQRYYGLHVLLNYNYGNLTLQVSSDKIPKAKEAFGGEKGIDAVDKYGGTTIVVRELRSDDPMLTSRMGMVIDRIFALWVSIAPNLTTERVRQENSRKVWKSAIGEITWYK